MDLKHTFLTALEARTYAKAPSTFNFEEHGLTKPRRLLSLGNRYLGERDKDLYTKLNGFTARQLEGLNGTRGDDGFLQAFAKLNPHDNLSFAGVAESVTFQYTRDHIKQVWNLFNRGFIQTPVQGNTQKVTLSLEYWSFAMRLLFGFPVMQGELFAGPNLPPEAIKGLAL